MKSAIALLFLLACSGVLLGDSRDTRGASPDQPSLLQDLVRLTKGGLSDETVLAYARAHRAELPPKVSSDELLWLRKSGVGETVIRYMAAIDVRASDADDEEVVADDSGRAARYSAAADWSGDDSDGDSDSYPESSYASDPDSYDAGYPDGYYSSYPASYYNDYYPVYGAGFYPYPVYFFANHGGSFRRFHRHGHRFAGRHGSRNDHRGFGRPRHSRGGFDRSRDGGRRSFVSGHRGPGRSLSPRGNFGPGPGPGRGFAGPRGAVMRGGGGGRSGIQRPAFGRGAPGPRGAVAHNGGFRSPGFSGGGRSPGVVSRAPVGGSISRAPVARSGGRPGGGGQPMARGRR